MQASAKGPYSLEVPNIQDLQQPAPRLEGSCARAYAPSTARESKCGRAKMRHSSTEGVIFKHHCLSLWMAAVRSQRSVSAGPLHRSVVAADATSLPRTDPAA